MTDKAMEKGNGSSKFVGFVKEKGLFFLVIAALAESILNLLFLKSEQLGLFATIVFLITISAVCGKVLFEDDPLILRLVKGFFIFLTVLTINGLVVLYLGSFTLTASIVITVFWSGAFLFLYVKKRFASVSSSFVKANFWDLLLKAFLGGLAGAVVVFSFYILLLSRTMQPQNDVWTTIPIVPFLPLVFAAGFAVICAILFERGNYLQLAMIAVVSVLIESIYYLVWYPSLYGDPLTTLGIARFVNQTGGIYAFEFLTSQGLLVSILTGSRGYSVAIVQLTRLLNVDIYWVHNIAVPLLWAIIAPVSLYEITCVLVNEHTRRYPREAVLSAFSGALLVPLLITWGANPTSNTLGFLFLFFSFSLILRWVFGGGRVPLFLAVLGCIATFMTHPMPGIFAAVFLAGGAVMRTSEKSYLKISWLALLTLVLPIALVYSGSGFVPQGLVSLQSFVGLEQAILTVSFIPAVVGIFLSFKRENINHHAVMMMISFYLLVIVDFYIAQFGLTNVAYGADRALVISAFLLTPFMAIFLSSLLEILGFKISSKSNPSLQPLKKGVPKGLKWVGVGLIILLLSSQVVVTVYEAYPHNETGLAPTAYEADAIYYINSTATRRFVVVSDTLFTNLAIGLLGEGFSYRGENMRGTFGIADWGYPIQQDFASMMNQPSTKTLDDAMSFAAAEQAYFVVSIRDAKFSDAVQQLSDMLPVEKVFGDGKLYIFKYPVPIFQGSGPNLIVTYDNSSPQEIGSQYSYAIKKAVTYSVVLTGHNSYNVSNYPLEWLFDSLTVNDVFQNLDNSSDIDNFVFLKGVSSTDTVKVSWLANEEYSPCGWRENSFKTGWAPYPKYYYKLDPIIQNGYKLSLSGSFTPGVQEDYYYARPANVSTDLYPYIIIKWSATDRVAVSYVYFDDGSNQEIIPFGSASTPSWTVTTVKLDPGKRIVYVMVGLSNIESVQTVQRIQTLFVNYILICNGTV